MLSTCNRTEIYARCTQFHPAVRTSSSSSPSSRRRSPDDFADHLYTYYDDAAVAHLFGVAAGLDSMIVGEGEILGQVREAWQSPRREGRAGSMLAALFRHAVEVGKRVAHRDRHRPPRRSRSRRPRSRSRTRRSGLSKAVVCSCSAPARSARGSAVALAVGRCRRGRRREPHRRARAAARAARVGGRAIPLGDLADALVADRRAALHDQRVRRVTSSAATSRR